MQECSLHRKYSLDLKIFNVNEICKYEKFRKKLFPCNSNDKLDIEMEIIYGHAWGREPSLSQNEHVIDASNIMRRKINS